MNNIQEKTIHFESALAAKTLPRGDFTVFESRPTETERILGGLILAQEIFGVNSHIREIARHYAEMGYVVWAPPYFDHIRPGIELTYDQTGMTSGREYMQQLKWDIPLDDTQIAAEALKARLPQNRQKLAMIGYCWGGSLVWLASGRLKGLFQAGSAYYGSAVLSNQDLKPQYPVILHFGTKDTHIPINEVESFASANPTLPVYKYEADHGFNCNWRASFDAKAADLAEKRTVELLKKTMA